MNSKICAICGKPITTESGVKFCLKCKEKYGLGESAPRARAAPRVQREATEQEALFTWAKAASGCAPELKLLYHIPNGGKRNRFEAANLKRQGVKAGVPDICLPVSRGGFHGLYIELKAGNNKATENQNEWLEALRTQGYAAEVCVGWKQAQELITEYLEMRGTKDGRKF